MNIKFDESFNWLAVLKDLAAGAPISDEDYAKLKELSAQWPTCACGQLCQNLPRDTEGAPIDEKLVQLGFQFNDAIVFHRDFSMALRVFHKIEARTAELLK